MNGKAKFVHWLVSPFSDIPSEPMFNIVSCPQNPTVVGSTVGGSTLMALYGINLPLFPDLKTWQRMVEKKQKCGHCWASIRGAVDLIRHLNLTHGASLFRRLALLVVALSFLGVARAWEFDRNPDRFPSLGLNVASTHRSGPHTDLNGPPDNQIRQQGRANDDAVEFTADVRVPVSDTLTVNAGVTGITGDREWNRDNVYSSHDNLDGYRASVGLRLYFNK